MASSALATGQVETARRLYERLLEFDPESVDARMGLGDVALADREAAQAANWYLAAVAYADAPAQRQAALLAHGRAALAAGDLDAAGASFGRLIDPRENASRVEVAWGYNGVGLVNLLAGNPREAVAALEQAVLRAPDEPRFQANLDRALRMVANYRAPETSAEASTDTQTSTDAPPPATVDVSPTVVNTSPAVSPDDELIDVPAAPPVTDEPPTEPSLEDLVVDSEPSRPTQSRSRPQEQPEAAAPPDIEPTVLIDIQGVTPTADPVDSEPADDAPGEETAGQPDPVVEEQPTARHPQQAPEEPVETPEAPAAGVSAAFVVRTPMGDYLQVGAYAEETRALDQASRLSALTDLPVRIDEGDTGDLLFRVQIGPLPADGLPADLADTLGVDIDRLRNVDRVETQTEPEPPEQLRSIVEDGLAYIEIGIFASHDNAEAAAVDLEARAFPVEVTKVSRGGAEPTYHVRVGPIDPNALAQTLKALQP